MVRPLRADAARNRERVLQVAYETFAAEGLSVPIDEIARRAGVGAGTVYRHFPTKEDLFRAVVDDRIRGIIAWGRALLHDVAPGEALFTFLRTLVLKWGATDRGMSEALAGAGVSVEAEIPEIEDEFLAMLGELLRAGQDAGTVRGGISVAEVKALLVGLQAVQGYNSDAATTVIDVVLDGLRST
ncbi:TetR/AcrR family transcriptional regulator [Mycolicibacterium sp. 018/SC-01/001]|uniref:TetR/AcrR family transcriptional regulator n=1 Tax=Mycolicibacterium sp. 018/SC-01/001 TaxID=2592069 RepID=UPI0011810FEE|nr:TetR/AcrR family transcriptional regulator [Mycolicibacterium sp. 018/SC-01/001]TRW82783.1 TetR/AcrR family transcriptional regulator [Mycolicibacterium sp. 018/SC-01/001]